MKVLAVIVLIIFHITPYLVFVSTSPTTALHLSTTGQTSTTIEPIRNITTSPDDVSTRTSQLQTSPTFYTDTTEPVSEKTLSPDDVSTQTSQSQTTNVYTDTTESVKEVKDVINIVNGEKQIESEKLNLSNNNNYENTTVTKAHDPINSQIIDVIQPKTTYIDPVIGVEEVQDASNGELNIKAVEMNFTKDKSAETSHLRTDVISDINAHERDEGQDPSNSDKNINGTEVVTQIFDEQTTETTTIIINTTLEALSIPFDSIRLPQSIKPSTYEITMKPYIYENTVEPFKYECKTVVNITCSEETNVIKLHAVQHEIIKIQLINVTDNVTHVNVLHFELDEPTAMLGILLEKPMKKGNQYILSIESTGLITDSLQGFYRSPYKVGNQTRYIVTTMMEPTDARMVFPCFDEPDFKAVFLFYIYRKNGFTCLTNLPKRETIGPDEDGFYLDIFDQPRNVPMSTYLVAIAIGDLAFEEAYFRDVPFRTWSRSNAAHLTDFSLEIGVRTMEFFEDYFKIKYPLPKQDMIAVPTMSFNAMEHWGLITCREESMFYEEGVSSASDMEWTAVLVAHETSHQWFGNIVSPRWWDELWLNEGFATYMMILAVDQVIPEWEMMTKMVTDYRGTQSVMSVDDTLTSHPVYVPVEHPSEIGEIFDLISYAKGSAVIRMMNFILGDDTFRDGLTRFLDRHSYDTATHEDLWNSLHEQAVEDNNTVTDVQGIMDNWIKEMNYPVVVVTRNGLNICLKQFAFLLSEEERQNRSHIFWEIPFTYTSDIQTSFDKESHDIVWLRKDGHKRCFQDQLLENSKWIVGNIRQYGYFRVNYDNENWKAILQQLSENHEVIHPMNRAQIINDAWNLASAGLLDFEIALGTFDYLDEELHFVPWKAAILNLQYIERSLQHFPIYGDFKKFMRNKIQKAFFNSAGAQTHNEKIRYTMIGYEACQYGLKACVDDALERFNDWMTDENVLVNPDMKATVYCTGVKKGGAEAWEFVLDKYLHTDSSTERRFLVEALACTEEPWLLSKLTNIVLYSPSDYFLSTDKILAISEMATTSVGRLFAWNVIEEHWDLLFEKYGTELNLFPRLVTSITKSFNLPYELRRLERLAEEKQSNSVTGPRLFASALSHVRSNIRWIDEHYQHLEQWIQKGL